MFHKNRRWSVSVVPSVEELADMLTQRTWTLCSGFYVAGYEDYLFLNDATHEDGAGEYGVVKRLHDPDRLLQIESITFSWCLPEKARTLISEVLAGEMDSRSFAQEVQLHFDPPEQHRCHLCA